MTEDHNYIKKKEYSGKKRICKNKQLENSLQMNNNLITILKDRKSAQEVYYKEKIEFLKYKKLYYQDKIDVMRDISNNVRDIKTLLENC